MPIDLKTNKYDELEHVDKKNVHNKSLYSKDYNKKLYVEFQSFRKVSCKSFSLHTVDFARFTTIVS